MSRPPAPIFIVTLSVSAVSLIFVLALAYCAVAGVSPDERVLEALKNIGLVAFGSLASLLTSVRTQPADTSTTTTVLQTSETLSEEEDANR